ncbi:MAG: hypothetical protein AAGG68_24350 [Bacteroidota bacterium]
MDQKHELNYNRKRYKYPARYDIEQTLGKFAQRDFVEEFANNRGIFITKATREQLADKLSYFFYDDDDIEEIRDVAYKTSRTQTLSGFSVSLKEGAGLVDSIRNAFQNNEFDSHVDVSPLIKTNNTDFEEYKSEVTYNSKKPGRIEFLQEESITFDLIVRKTAENDYQILTVGNKATDDSICKKIIKKSIKKRGNIVSLDHDDLTTPQTIVFFDNLANDGIQGEWNLLEVRKLTLRRGEDEIQDASTNDLVGISQAVLDGDNLRHNSFVKQTEENGYRFMSMTYRFAHNSEPYIIDIKAEFKLRPKLYVVDVVEFYEVFGTKGVKLKKEMNPSFRYEVKDKLWNSSRRIFEETKNE